MVAQLELILLGFAVVVDSVLWIAIVERVNRPNTAVWLTTLVGATWCAHAFGFAHVLLREVNEPAFVALDRWILCVIAASLLVIPSAMLHAAIRLNTRHDNFVRHAIGVSLWRTYHACSSRWPSNVA